MDDFNDVPPLEDMSELLEQAKQIQSQQQKESSSSAERLPASSTSVPTKNTTLLPSKDPAKSNSPSLNRDSERTSETTNAKGPKSSSHSSGGFGGMKKGFLFGGPSKKSTPAGKSSAAPSKPTPKADPNPVGGNDIPLIRPRESGGHDGKEQYRFEEVQNALKDTAPLLQNKDWITDSLLSSLKDHPRLAKQLTEPKFTQAVQKFQTNPQLAMEEYKDNAEVQQFFKDFCGLLGNHFTSMGDASPTPNPMPSSGSIPPSQGIQTRPPASSPDIVVRSSTDPKQPTAAEEAKMQQILSDPEIMEILKDQQIQALMNTLRANPDQGQRILQSANSQMKGKIQKLVQAGLLGFT